MSANRTVVVPASMMIDPPSGSWSSAALAIRSFCAAFWPKRWSTGSSMLSRSTGIAPPCTRRSTPRRSRPVRSRRMVSGVTSNRSASPLTSTRPAERAWPRMACCRSGAYMSTPLSLSGGCVGCSGADLSRCVAAVPVGNCCSRRGTAKSWCHRVMFATRRVVLHTCICASAGRCQHIRKHSETRDRYRIPCVCARFPSLTARIIFHSADERCRFGLSCWFCGLVFGVVNGNTPLPFRFWGCLKVPEL